jgi:dTDP-D-glucose 4,6-dehydratase
MLEDGENKKDEQSILCPTNPYAATKAGAELLAKAYYFSYKMPIIITRSNNVYGPNQYHEKVIPRFIKLLQEGDKVTIQGDGSNVRSFLHVQDVSSAIYLVLENGKVGEIYNIGGDDDDEYTVLQVAQMLIEMMKGTTDYDEHITYVPDRPFNDKRYYISNEKVKSLGWAKTKNFLDGLRELI